uniref:SPRY domain-containing protein n=1 Tax=Globodera rostochiensis TaxID=31243 RepID=A0A914HGF2_GLORO
MPAAALAVVVESFYVPVLPNSMNSPSSEASFDFVDTLGAENGGGSFEVDESGGSFEVAEKGADQFGAADQQGQTKSGQLLENVVVLQHQTLLKMGEYQKEQQHNQTEICAQIGELKKLVGPVAAGALTEQRRAEADQALQAKHQKLLMDHEALRAEIAEMKQLQKMQEQRQAQMLQGLDELRKAFTGGSVGTEAVKEGTGDGTDADKEGTGDETEAVKEGTEDGIEVVKKGTGDETEAVKEGTEDGTEAVKEGTEDGTEVVKKGTEDGREIQKATEKKRKLDQEHLVKMLLIGHLGHCTAGRQCQYKHCAAVRQRIYATGVLCALTPHNRWDVAACYKGFTLIEPKRLTVHGDWEFNDACCYVFAERPIPKKDVGIFYYELKLLQSVGLICIGLTPKQIPFEGYEFGNGAYAYLDRGIPGDVVGYGLNLATRQVIYTRNGVHLNTPNSFDVDLAADLFPCVTFEGYGDKVKANFGPNFLFSGI